jgi:glycosyltransferase involved in cell wall biosynthesis
VKTRLKHWIFSLLGKDPEAVVVTFHTGDAALCGRMQEEIRGLVPDRRHFVVKPSEHGFWRTWLELRRKFRRYRIGLAPVMLGPGPNALRRAAYLLAPRKILAYNTRLERHHLGFNLASLLFWHGVPLDRIWLRPRWWPWRRDRSTVPTGFRTIEGRAFSGRPRVAVLSPYFPYPLAHGGAVRIYNLLREIAREFDVLLFSFVDAEDLPDAAQVLEFCSQVTLVKKPRYREPRWSTLLPPEVHEFSSPAMRSALVRAKFDLLQVEYTQLAPYGGDILVEHDVTFDLFQQVRSRGPTLAAWWDWFRWRRFETRAVRHYRGVVAMSAKDAGILGAGVRTIVIENGVDLERFAPQPETAGQRLLFIGSFRHFPNVLAYRFFAEQVWPKIRGRFPAMALTVVCGPDHLTYWRAFTDSIEPAPDERIRLLGFVSDVRPLYAEANLVIVPTTVSAGTNVKVLEAMAMDRAVVSTGSGCAGLGLEHGHTVWIAETADEFAEGVAGLASDPTRRASIAHAAREHALRHFDWKALGEKQRQLLRDLLGAVSDAQPGTPKRRGHLTPEPPGSGHQAP